MAKIEMDLSEFKTMEENKALLEKALEKEESLNNEIKNLQQEKIDILKNAEKKVSKVITKRTEQHLLTKVDEVSRDHIRRFIDMVSNTPRSEMLRFSSTHHDSVKDFMESLLKVCTSKTTSFSPDETSVTVHGLDEVKAEIEEDLYNKQSEEVKDKLERLKVSEELIESMKAEIKKHRAEYKLSREHIIEIEASRDCYKDSTELLEGKLKVAKSDHKTAHEMSVRLNNTITDIRKILTISFGGIFKNGKTLKKIKDRIDVKD